MVDGLAVDQTLKIILQKPILEKMLLAYSA